MKRAIILVLLAACLLPLITQTARAGEWDPRNPPVYPARPSLEANPETDDSGWNDPTKSSDGRFWLSIDLLLHYLHLDFITTPASHTNDKQRDEAYGPEIIECRGTDSGQTVR